MDLDGLFRRESGRLLAALTRWLGRERFDLAEEAVQEALVAALRTWPFQGVPSDPAAWLLAAARNRALDVMRRHKLEMDLHRFNSASLLRRSPRGEGERAVEPAEIEDDTLRLMFLCCHPSLEREDQVALTLQAVSGFSAAEIARAFLMTEAAVAQRLVRAKKKVRESRAPFEVPEGAELAARLGAVMDTVYLAFNEGYTPRDGEEPIREAVAEEAVRLAELIPSHPACDRPEAHALAALLEFQASRLAARLGPAGELRTLAEQDRSLWSQARIARGVAHLARAGQGSLLSEYHLLAGIAAVHALAPSFEGTDWCRIVSLYDALLRLTDTPVVRLNRAVAVSMADGPAAGLAALAPFASPDPLVCAARADCLQRLRQPAESARSWSEAARLATTGVERRYYESRAARL